MKDLKNPDYKSMHYKELSDRTLFVKDRDEVNKMTEFWQNVMDKGIEKRRKLRRY